MISERKHIQKNELVKVHGVKKNIVIIIVTSFNNQVYKWMAQD